MQTLRPDVILTNARIHPLASASGSATGLAIAGEQILACGEGHALQPLATTGTDVIDLGGRAVLPGLIDAHIHLELYALSLERLDCETTTLEACLQRVAERAKAIPPGTWILGHGWNQNAWGRYGTLPELDAAAPHHPVYLTAKSLHAAWANSSALAIARLNAQSSDPPGGMLGRDQAGALNGLLFEAAVALVAAQLPRPTAESLATSLLSAQTQLWAYGITGVHDFDGARCLSALQLLRESGQLGLRVLKHLQLESLRPALDLGLRSGFGDDWLRIGNLKLFADGALGPRTAAMIEDYDLEPGNRGQLLLDAEAITETGALARAGGIALAIHAIGDLANHHALQAVTRLTHIGRAPALPDRIEHLQVLHPDDFQLAAQAGVIASMQPIHAPSDQAMAIRHWGSRTARAYAWRSFASAGVPLAFGSDAPVESPNPFWGLHAAITRQRPGEVPWHPEQTLDLETAVQAYTSGPARAARMRGRQGTLMPGALADLIVLERDPFELAADRIRELLPVGVMVGGRWRVRGF